MPSWLLCATWVTVAALVAAMWALRSAGARRAALLAVSAGVANGFMAVLTKSFADRLSGGIVATLQSWQPYALAGAGIVALLVTQSAYQASRPTIVLPTINVVDPLVSVLIGISLLGGHLQAIYFEVLALIPFVAVRSVVMPPNRKPP